MCRSEKPAPAVVGIINTPLPEAVVGSINTPLPEADNKLYNK